MTGDVILNKVESIERCVLQARSFYARPSECPFEDDYLRQDAVMLNVQRAVEQAIALANHLIKTGKLGLPKESRESFRILEAQGLVPEELSKRLQAMVGFRNVLVHEYQRLDIGVMREVVEHRLDDLLEFTRCILALK